MKVKQFKQKLQMILDELDFLYDDEDEIDFHGNTYGINYFMSLPGKGIVDLHNIVKEEDDD